MSGVLAGADWEASARWANELLVPLQLELEARAEPIRPIIHVVGPPRSGTTLAMQLIAACTDIGYVDNTTAAFWNAPAYGLLLSLHLNRGARRSGWRSTYGRTDGPTEPHEFGRFWLDVLGYRSMAHGDRIDSPIDWALVRARLASMTTVAQRPMLFKSFVAAWHLADMAAQVGPVGVVRIHRDPIDTATSLLTLRDHQSRDRSVWASVRPPDLGDVSSMAPAEQVVRQVLCAERELDRQVQAQPDAVVLDVHYADLCRRPASVVADVVNLVGRLGEVLQVTADPPAFTMSAANQDDPDYSAVVAASERLMTSQ